MPHLSEQELHDFLAQRGVLLRIATIRSDGSPMVTPIWFVFEEDAVWFTPRARSEWFTNLKRDPRCAVTIDEDALPYRKLILEGKAELVHDLGADDVWRDRYRRIAGRYVPPAAAEAYVQDTIDQARALYRMRLDAVSSKTWRMPLEGEAGDGIWHQRYYAEGTKLARD